MPAGIVRFKGRWYILLTTYEIHHRGEAEETVKAKLEKKMFPARVFLFDSWGDAVVLGNALTDEFLDDWSAGPYAGVTGEKVTREAIRAKAPARKTQVKVQPEWKEKLKGVKGIPSVKVTVKKKRKPVK